MSKIKNGFNRYQLTYPFDGHNIYETRSMSKAVKKCYKDFKMLNDFSEGIFTVTNLDKGQEYNFKIKNDKLYEMNKNKYIDKTKSVPQFIKPLCGGYYQQSHTSEIQSIGNIDTETGDVGKPPLIDASEQVVLTPTELDRLPPAIGFDELEKDLGLGKTDIEHKYKYERLEQSNKSEHESLKNQLSALEVAIDGIKNDQVDIKLKLIEPSVSAKHQDSGVIIRKNLSNIDRINSIEQIQNKYNRNDDCIIL